MRRCLLVVSIVVRLRAENAGSVALLEERNNPSTHYDDTRTERNRCVPQASEADLKVVKVLTFVIFFYFISAHPSVATKNHCDPSAMLIAQGICR